MNPLPDFGGEPPDPILVRTRELVDIMLGPETPTGWKYFGNLFDAGLITLCGEESIGTGSDHVREKDDLWSVLFWLQLLAVRREPVAAIVRKHRGTYGRDFCPRHDFEGLGSVRAQRVLKALGRRDSLLGRTFHGRVPHHIEDLRYTDTVDGSSCGGHYLLLRFDVDTRITRCLCCPNMMGLAYTSTSDQRGRTQHDQTARDMGFYSR